MAKSFIRKITSAIRRRALWLISPSPVDDYCEHSIIHPVQSGPSAPNEFLIELTLNAAREAQKVALPEIAARVREQAHDFTPTWPGEHYRLLAAVVKILRPTTVVEIGTFQGLSALALMKFLPSDGHITTFDIVRWNDVSTTCLVESDFADNRLQQELGDLADPIVFDRYRQLFERTELLFVDAPKDGIFERRFLQNLETIQFNQPLLVMFDDIRVWNMLAIWHEIARPKIDITSFGHWSGTGLIDWRPH